MRCRSHCIFNLCRNSFIESRETINSLSLVEGVLNMKLSENQIRQNISAMLLEVAELRQRYRHVVGNVVPLLGTNRIQLCIR
jgi:hypothetical protein